MNQYILYIYNINTNIMRTYKAIVVEDELMPLQSLVSKLEIYHKEIIVVDTCTTCELAITSILKHKPDLLFLDINLPDGDSLQMLEEIQKSTDLPYIIFTTAYDASDYLLKAIKYSAIDYILKPVKISDLAIAINKLKEHVRENNPISSQYLFKTVSGNLYISDNNILYFKADGNYTYIYFISGSELLLERISAIEVKLNKELFIRAGRSVIINKLFLHKIDKKRGTCIFRTGERVEVSKSGIENIVKELNIKL